MKRAKKHLRALSAGFLAILLAFALLSCADTGPVPEETDSTPAVQEIVVMEGGTPQVTIVRQDVLYNDDPEVQAAVAVRKALEAYTSDSCRVSIATDWDHGKEDDSLEILVGGVNSPAAAAAAGELGYGEYIVELVGSKIVVAGFPNRALRAAGDALAELFGQYLSEDGTRIAIPKEALHIRNAVEANILFGLVVSDKCTGYVRPSAAAAKTEVKLAKYDTLDVKGEPDSDWFAAELNGKTVYFSSSDVRGFPNLSELKGYASVVWARDIAADNDFHYGDNAWAHYHGCYYCGTNGMNNAKVKAGGAYEDQLKTYCCNPFVTAAYCHGGGAVKQGTDMTVAVNCRSRQINLANDTNVALTDQKYFQLIPKPVSIMELLPGDILLTPKHAMLVSENGMIVEASGGDDNVRNSDRWNNSIRERAIPDSSWNSVTKIYRYIGE